MWIDIQAVSGRKLCPRDSLNHICEAFFQVSFGNHFTLPGSESLFGISQDPPMCKHASLSQVVFQRRDLWVDWHYSPLTSKEPFCACIVRKVSLTLKMRNGLYLSCGQVSASLIFNLEYLSTGDSYSCSAWGPSISRLSYKGYSVC